MKIQEGINGSVKSWPFTLSVIILDNDEVQKMSYLLLCGLNIYSDYVIAIYMWLILVSSMLLLCVCCLE